MPAVSKRQYRYVAAQCEKGKEWACEWKEKTHNVKDLPESAPKQASDDEAMEHIVRGLNSIVDLGNMKKEAKAAIPAGPSKMLTYLGLGLGSIGAAGAAANYIADRAREKVDMDRDVIQQKMIGLLHESAKRDLEKQYAADSALAQHSQENRVAIMRLAKALNANMPEKK